MIDPLFRRFADRVFKVTGGTCLAPICLIFEEREPSHERLRAWNVWLLRAQSVRAATAPSGGVASHFIDFCP